MHTTRIAGLLAAVAMLLTGCANNNEAEAEADTKPKPTASKTKPAIYDIDDCTAIIERMYQTGDPYDASSDPECEHLTHDEYGDAIADVLTGHKDDFLNHAAWDVAWEETDRAQQEAVCERLDADGAAVVGQEIINEAGDDASGDEIDMAQYILDKKCDDL